MRHRLNHLASFFVAMIVAIVANSGACAAQIDKVTVFKAGQDGYHTYRIPVLVQAKNGDLLAFAEGRKNSPSDNGDIDIVLKRSSDQGKTWGPLEMVQDDDEDPKGRVWIGNPTPIVDHSDSHHPGRIWLVFTRSNAQMFVTHSDDNGKTWSKRRDISPETMKAEWGWCAAGPVHGIQLEHGPHAGRLVAPCDHQNKASKSWGSHIVYSDDHGATWKLGAVDTRPAGNPLHPNECVAVELADGRVYVNARDNMGSDPATRAVAYSSDGGQSLDAPFVAEPNITSPVVQNSVVRMTKSKGDDGKNLLIYSGPSHASKRLDLTILVSEDEGKTWGRKTVIHLGPAAYSDLVKLDDDHFGVIFEGGQRLYDEIVFAKVALDDLNEK